MRTLLPAISPETWPRTSIVSADTLPSTVAPWLTTTLLLVMSPLTVPSTRMSSSPVRLPSMVNPRLTTDMSVAPLAVARGAPAVFAGAGRCWEAAFPAIAGAGRSTSASPRSFFPKIDIVRPSIPWPGSAFWRHPKALSGHVRQGRLARFVISRAALMRRCRIMVRAGLQFPQKAPQSSIRGRSIGNWLSISSNAASKPASE